MRNMLLSVVVVATLVTAGVGGTFAGFVDTEVSEANFYQAGITDLLVNGKNDPIGAKLQYTHGAPCKSIDFWVDLYNWGVCQGGMAYMHYKLVESEEDGTKLHDGLDYVYDAIAVSTTPGVPNGYREAVGTEPKGPGVWSSEPEKISEVGDGYIAEYYIADDNPNLLGEDYATGIAEHLDITTYVPLKGATGEILGNPDTDGDGEVSSAEEAAWVTNGNRWDAVDSLSGKLLDIACHKDYIGFLETQKMTYIHIDVHLQQIYAEEWYDANGVRWDQTGSQAVGVDYDLDGDIDADDFQKACWPTNALQGDKATWDMLFELIADP
jgi:hypothetical protein